MTWNEQELKEMVEKITRDLLARPGLQEGHLIKRVESEEGVSLETWYSLQGEVVRAALTNGEEDLSPDEEIAALIDHTLLKPEAVSDQITTLCEQAREYRFASVCVNPVHVKLCGSLLGSSSVKVCTVVGFPLGASATPVKVYETAKAVEQGAEEIDMVINIGALKEGNLTLAARDIREVVRTGHQAGALVKVIIETALLTDEEKITACLLAKAAGADFVKTSTGFSSGGATVEDVALMRRVVGPEMGVKASGGVRDINDARSMVKAGASRIGASAGIKIVEGARVEEA
ncbi:MAG: deoxyribose-phosphate aldolase [Anaerolineales bacterium]|nr:deoxyribose-phosphate aldolase [Anaerolineales bacterium]